MSAQSGSGYGQNPPGPGGQSGPPPYQPAGTPEEPQKSRTWLYWTAAIVAALAVGVGGYFLGVSQGKKDYDPGTSGYKSIYNKGFEAGQAAGTASGQAQGQKQGQKQGEAAGQKAGLEQGQKQGEAQGTQQGAAAALGGFSSWQTDGTFYVIQMSAGTQDAVPYTISSRVPMDSDYEYTPCAADPSTLCTIPKGSSGGNGGGSANAGADTTNGGGASAGGN